MKKLLVIVLGLFVFTACGDGSDANGGGAAGNGNGGTLITEKLTTSLVEITVPIKDLGIVLSGSVHDVKFTVKNLSATDPMQLKRTNTRNPDLISGSLNSGNCTEPGGESTYSQPAGSSCEFTQPLLITTTTEGSPFVRYFEDANGDKLAVVIKYTIDQTPATEKLVTPLVEIKDISTKDLGNVKIGEEYPFEFTIQNKSNTDVMQLKLIGLRNKFGFPDGSTCIYDPDTDIYSQPASASCVMKMTVEIDVKNVGSPSAMYFKDANGDEITIVVKYTLID